MSKLALELTSKYKLISDQIEPGELLVILTELERVLDADVEGDIVEFGCYSGTTSLFIQRLLIEHRKRTKRLTGVALESVLVQPGSTEQAVKKYGDASTGLVKPKMAKNLAVQDAPHLGRLGGARPVRLYVYDSFDGLPEKSKQDESPLGIDFKRGELRSTKADFIHNFRKANLPLPIICKKWFHEVEEHELPPIIAFAFLDGDYYKSIRSSLNLVLPRIQPGGVIIVDDYDNPALPGAKKAIDSSGIKTSSLQVRNSLAILKL